MPTTWQIGAALMVCLSACDQQRAVAAADDCLDLPVDVPTGMTDLRQEVYICVERNAAFWAKGPDTPDAISRAVITKCEPVIIRFVEHENPNPEHRPYKEALEAWRRHALPVIAEARARGCYS